LPVYVKPAATSQWPCTSGRRTIDVLLSGTPRVAKRYRDNLFIKPIRRSDVRQRTREVWRRTNLICFPLNIHLTHFYFHNVIITGNLTNGRRLREKNKKKTKKKLYFYRRSLLSGKALDEYDQHVQNDERIWNRISITHSLIFRNTRAGQLRFDKLLLGKRIHKKTHEERPNESNFSNLKMWKQSRKYQAFGLCNARLRLPKHLWPEEYNTFTESRRYTNVYHNIRTRVFV